MKFGFRFLIPLLGISVIGGSTLAVDHSVSGHARTRMEFVDNSTLLDTQASEQWLNRIRLNMDIMPSKALQVRITPQFTNTFGSQDAGDNTDARFTAHEAWMSWMASDMLTLYVGRQDVQYAKGLIIGHNDWSQAGSSHDAVRARLSFDLGHADILVVKQKEGMTLTPQTADNDLFGFYAMLNPDMGAVKNVDLYGYWADDRTTGDTTGKTRLFTLGARAEGDINALSYGFEVAAQFGKYQNATSQKGLMADLDVGMKVMNDHHIGLNLAYANTEWNGVAPATHDDLGDSDLVSRNNILAIGLLTNWKLHEKWSSKVNGYIFMAPKSDVGPGMKAGGITGTKDSKMLGIEGDLVLTYTAEKALNFDLGYNVFKGLSYLDGSKIFNKLYLQGTVNF